MGRDCADRGARKLFALEALLDLWVLASEAIERNPNCDD